MLSLENYRHSHAELRQMIDELRSMLTLDLLKFRPNAKVAYEMLCDLGEKVDNHLSDEDRGLYPTLLIHDDPKVKSIAWGFISGEKPLRKVFDDYHKRWLQDCEFDFSDDFLAETYEMFDMVAKRIEREEQVLVPKLLEIGLFQDHRRSRSMSY